MKRQLFAAFAALAALLACQKELTHPEQESPAETPIVFELSANYADGGTATKAVKTGWEAGDVIYVFFTGVSSPRHLQMRYDGTSWTTHQMNNLTEESIGLGEGDEGTMRAVYAPFIPNDGIYSTSSAEFTFVEYLEGQSYYLTASLHYIVKDGKVSGAFNMTIPEGYVQFWIEDKTVTLYETVLYLSTDALVPTMLKGVKADASMSVETVTEPSGYAIMGHWYNGGWLFSGVLADGYTAEFGDNYYFVLVMEKKESGTWEYVWRKDLFVPGKTLSSHSAVVLPAINSSRWQMVGPEHTVELIKDGVSYGEWHTCNYGMSAPEYLGDGFDYDTANSLGYVLPTEDQWLKLVHDFENGQSTLSHTRMKILHYDSGRVVWGDSGFIFLPDGEYWTSTAGKAVRISEREFSTFSEDGTKQLMVRALKSPATPQFNAFNPESTY